MSVLALGMNGLIPITHAKVGELKLTNCLVSSWQNWEPFSIDNFLLLCKTQKSLKVLDLGPMDRPLLPLFEKNPNIFNDLADLHSVDLYPDTLDRLQVSQKLLHDKPRIEYLCISNAFEYSNEVPDDLHDSSTRPGLLSRTLFSHMQPFDRCEPMCLRNLDLDTINLRVSLLVILPVFFTVILLLAIA